MADSMELLGHLLVLGRAEDQDFRRRGGGRRDIRAVDRLPHGRRISNEAVAAFDGPRGPSEFAAARLQAIGTIITIEGASGFDMQLERFEQQSRHKASPRPKWLLLTVRPATEHRPQSAHVWVSDEYRASFLKLFERYVDEEHARSGKPKNEALVANIARIRSSVLRDLWQSEGEPPTTGRHWWEVWLRPNGDAVALTQRFANAVELQLLESSLRFDNRHVVWLRSRWDQLESLPFSSVPVTELRRPSFVDTIEDLEHDEQFEYADDLEQRVEYAHTHAPAVCLLDTGVQRTHRLLSPALTPQSEFSVLTGPKNDLDGHGTKMAGLALMGSLDDPLLSNSSVDLLHCLESVKFVPGRNSGAHKPEAYGVVTAQAVALPEIAGTTRRRVYSMPVTSAPDRAGEPSLWSATVDALAVGTDVGRKAGVIELLGVPDDSAKRLIMISAGNVNGYIDDYVSNCDTSPLDDPAQAWNAVTVGAYTELVKVPSDPSFAGWRPVAHAGDISPHSRTGVTAGGNQWPIKPDICMEGGNVLTDGAGDFHTGHPVVSLRTTSHRNDRAISSANATSAATSQAARLAARALATYPDYWPETIRGLVTHSAEWTPLMMSLVTAESRKTHRRNLLRRFGWGVPDDEGVRSSARNAVTMVVQDRFAPFVGSDHAMRSFRLHRLPWPATELMALGEADVELRITLSYFIEPSPSRRGWRGRYSYASHGLRFELQNPNESQDHFVRRVNQEASREESGRAGSSSSTANWLLGPNQRNQGSLHQDIWYGHGTELASTGTVAIHAVGGWWKNNRRSDRVDLPIRYSLLISLRTQTQNIDLYAPIAATIQVPVDTAVIAT